MHLSLVILRVFLSPNVWKIVPGAFSPALARSASGVREDGKSKVFQSDICLDLIAHSYLG